MVSYMVRVGREFDICLSLSLSVCLTRLHQDLASPCCACSLLWYCCVLLVMRVEQDDSIKNVTDLLKSTEMWAQTVLVFSGEIKTAPGHQALR